MAHWQKIFCISCSYFSLSCILFCFHLSFWSCCRKRFSQLLFGDHRFEDAPASPLKNTAGVFLSISSSLVWQTSKLRFEISEISPRQHQNSSITVLHKNTHSSTFPALRDPPFARLFENASFPFHTGVQNCVLASGPAGGSGRRKRGRGRSITPLFREYFFPRRMETLSSNSVKEAIATSHALNLKEVSPNRRTKDECVDSGAAK